MLIRNNFFNKKFFVGLICTLFLILLSFWMIDGYFDLSKELKFRSATVKDIINQRLTPLFSEIDNFPRTAGDNLLFLRQLSSLNNVLNLVGGQSEAEAVKNLEIDFLGFLRENIAYSKLRYIDEQGDEIVKVKFDGRVYKVVSKEEMNNKKGVDYFDITVGLNERDIFISHLILTAKSGASNSFIMRYATPVFDYNGNSKGIIISDIDADYFLENIRRFQREGEVVFLLNRGGYYLAHSDKDKEFAFTLGKNSNFYNDYPEVSEDILVDSNIKRFETDNLIFSFKHIYPTAGSFEIYKGSQKVFGENPEENYLWILVSISRQDEINKIFKDLNNRLSSKKTEELEKACRSNRQKIFY